MGSAHSTIQKRGRTTTAQVYSEVTRRCVSTFNSLELQYIRDTFQQLATPVGDVTIWTEDTFVKFLELPDKVGSLFFVSASYIASFPFTNESPAILTFDALIRTIAILTGRLESVLRSKSHVHLMYNSLAVQENLVEKEKIDFEQEQAEDDGHATLEDLELFEFSESNAPTSALRMQRSDLVNVLQFLLTIQQKSNVEVVSHYIDRFTGTIADELLMISEGIVSTISTHEKISFAEFYQFVKDSPDLLRSFSTLYSHFLFPSKLPAGSLMSRRQLDNSNLLNDATSSQLSLFLPRSLVFGKVDSLYRASHDGFSMGSFETKVLRYPGPTVMLLFGRTIADKQFFRLGMFSNLPWKQSSKDTFQDRSTTLFQLLPRHEIYKTPRLRHGIWFSKAVGIGIGCTPPVTGHKGHDFEDLSLVLDTCLEFATYRSGTSSDSPIKIEIRDVEVWGLGGDKEAQRKAWEWEENEANRRRNINVKDMQADYDLLEMAGLVGQNRSGGSV